MRSEPVLDDGGRRQVSPATADKPARPMHAIPKIGVVIPFFQRQTGLLRRAVESVCRQDCLARSDIHIVVVDDASPSPVQDDLTDLILPPAVQLTVISQANSGPSVARNTALAALPADTDYVAFIDSDDAWETHHLSKALAAFDQGVDLYFSDHLREDLFESYLGGWTAQLADTTVASPEDVDLLRVQAHKRALFMLQVVPATSSIAYRCAPHRDLRFKPDLRTAGEDQVFMLELVAGGASMGIGKTLSVRCGKGVNIYFDSLSWDRPACLSRLWDRLESFRLLGGVVPPDDREARAFIAGKTVLLERLVALVAARGVAKRLPGFKDRVLQLARSRPGFWLWAPRRLVEALTLKILGRFHPENE